MVKKKSNKYAVPIDEVLGPNWRLDAEKARLQKDIDAEPNNLHLAERISHNILVRLNDFSIYSQLQGMPSEEYDALESAITKIVETELNLNCMKRCLTDLGVENVSVTAETLENIYKLSKS